MIIEDIELRKLKSHVNYILRKDFYEKRIEKCCPICGGIYYIQHGLCKEVRKCKCKNYNKNFSKATNSIWSYSNK